MLKGVQRQARGVLPVAAYFGPKARTEEGTKSEVSGAMDGVANVAEAMPLSPALPPIMANLKQGNRLLSEQAPEFTALLLKSNPGFGHQ